MVLVSIALCSNIVDEYFYRAIDSLLLQTFKDIEIIVVLNGEAKNKANEVESKYEDIECMKVIATNISYINHSLNLAIDYSNGKYIARMDADDISYPNRIEMQWKFMEANSQVGMCGSWYDLIDKDDLFVSQVEKPCSDHDIRRSIVYGNPFCHPTVMFRKQIVASLGGYLNGMYAEDYDLWVRMAKVSELKFANIPQSLLGYRLVSNGAARGSRIAYRSVSEIAWREFISSGNPRWFFASIMSAIKAFIIAR